MLRLKEARKAKNLTQRRVADALNVTAATYNRYEKGVLSPDPIALSKLAEIFDVSVDYLLGRTDIATLSNYIELPSETTHVPIIGSVRCGNDGFAFQYTEGFVYVGEQLHGEIIAFICKGDSMKDLGIYDGDIAIVRRQEEIECGELAVVVIDGDEGTLKRIRKFDGGIILEAANPDYPPRVFTEERLAAVKIVGKVLEIRKRFK